MMHHGSVDFLWVSAGLGRVLLANQEPWVNRGGFSSVLPQDRQHAVGRALLLIPPTSGGGGSIEAGTKNELRKYISVPCLTVTEH